MWVLLRPPRPAMCDHKISDDSGTAYANATGNVHIGRTCFHSAQCVAAPTGNGELIMRYCYSPRVRTARKNMLVAAIRSCRKQDFSRRSIAGHVIMSGCTKIRCR
jgi:hypothetical protein